MLALVLGRERPRRSWSRGRPQSQHQNAKQQREINEGRRRGINYDHVECCELAYLYLVWFHVVYRSARVCMRPRACQCCASCTVIVWIGWMFELFIVSIVVGYIYNIFTHTTDYCYYSFILRCDEEDTSSVWASLVVVVVNYVVTLAKTYKECDDNILSIIFL